MRFSAFSIYSFHTKKEWPETVELFFLICSALRAQSIWSSFLYLHNLFHFSLENRNWKKRKLSSIEHYPCVKMPGATLISEYTFKIICCFDDWQSLYKWQSMHKKNDEISTRTRFLTGLQKELVKLATVQWYCSDWAEREMVLGR